MMTDVSLLTAITAVAVLSGATLQSATGFGFGLVAAPLLFAATSPEEAVGLMMILGLEINALTLAGERRRPRPLRAEAVALVSWALPGMLAGVLVLRSLDATALQVVVTVGVLASLAVRRLRPAPGDPGRWALPAAGLAAGALNTATSTSGPPLVLYLLRRDAEPAVVRDTLTVIFLAFSILGALALAVTQTTEAIPGAGWVAGLLPLVLLGHLLGRRGFVRLAGGRRYELALTVTLVAAALAGLVTVVL
jgi:uncharacterized membrane protein YfcA